MSRKTVVLTALVLITLVSLQSLVSLPVSAESAPSQLKIYVGPTSVPADNNAYNVIIVQLLDSKSIPIRAKEDTTVRLSSSLTNVGIVDSTITIPKGSVDAPASFHSTYTPGSTTITAAASGFMTVQATITTVGPIPSTLAVYGFPPLLPADGNQYDAVIVQLQDSAGTPAKAPIGDVEVTLSSSNETIGAVPPSIIIRGGSTHAVTTFRTTVNATGTAVVTAIASGYTSGQAAFTTQIIGAQPTNLKVYVAPPKVPADGETFKQVAVELQDAKGKIAKANATVEVTLSSSNTLVGAVQEQILIPVGASYALADFSSTYSSGTSTITAAATDRVSSQAALTTVGPIPSKLAVYCVPSVLPADGKSYESIKVQLQDSKGRPAKDPVGDITVYLFSSNPNAGNVSSTLTIPFGATHADGTFFATCAANSTTVTAQTSGYDPGQTKITTYLIDQFTLTMSVTVSPETVPPGSQATIKAYLTYNNTGPASGATVKFTSDKGANCSAAKDEGAGYYASVFTAPKVFKNTVYTITVNATKVGYNGTVNRAQVSVNPNSTSGVTGTIQVQVVEDNGSPVGDASVSSSAQPTGENTLNGVTNATGFVAFPNVLGGSYTFQISKEGYNTKEETVQFVAGQMASISVSLAKASFLSLTTIIAIVVVAVVAVVVAVFIIRRRRSSDETEE
ncbi:MAG: carboxypeptidase-like regulatory domain-containing protein [Candidatus Bathyarchaeia archaeon]